MVNQGQPKTHRLAAWLLAGLLAAVVHGGEPVVHELSLAHPAQARPLPCALIEEKDRHGQVAGYSMEVDSVTCAEKECEIIPVKMSWDELGNYIDYELRAGDQLTKKDHEVFTKADYKTLDKILGDSKSPLRWVAPDELVPPEEAVLGVDVVSRPTVLSQKGTVVKGAAYTCYTLWHWANGGVRDEIRRLTGESMGKARVLEFLKGDGQERRVFVLEWLAERKIEDQSVVDAVTGLVREGDDVVVRKALRCLERQAPGAFFKTIEGDFPEADRKKRVLFLQSLAATKQQLPKGYVDRISDWISRLDSYHEVDLMLKVAESRGAGGGKFVEQAVKLLGQENFLIARRAYWFLEEQKLSPEQKMRFDAFCAEHEDRL